MSCGAGLPSSKYSPFLIFSPWLKFICFPFGIKYEDEVPSGVTIETLSFPLSSFPNSIVPSFSAIIALSLGLLASNNSATRGNPPVISLVLDVALGNLARTSPAFTFWPSFTDKIESGTR